MKRLTARGDTIVEVLLCVAVVGAVIAGAYAAANRSLQTTRQSQERAEALQIAQQQVEILKLQVTTAGTPPLDKIFCFDPSTNAATPIYTTNTPAWGTLPEAATEDLSLYQAACRQTDRYNSSIDYAVSGTPASNSHAVYTVRVRWYRFGGNNTQELTLRYSPN